jgi:peptidoglycan/LPS O-acetylase OafA/YrhL
VVVAGLVGIAVGMAFAAWRSMRWTLDGRTTAGVGAVGSAALAGVTGALLVAGPLAALTVPTTAILVGFAIALRSGGDAPDGGDGPTDPPWWPSFERDLRRYERRRGVTPRRG